MTIPDSVTSIGESAFEYCTGLTSVTIPNSVTGIDCFAFFGCSSLTSITIPAGVTSIGNSAFRKCSKLTTINYNATNCTFMGSSIYPAFFDCNALTTINIGENVTCIPAYAFGSSLQILQPIGSPPLPPLNNVTSIMIPDSVISIGEYAFAQFSSLASVTIGKSVTSIGKGAFYGCSSLTSITIPAGVTSIGNSAFGNCSKLTTVNYNATSCTSSNSVFDNCSALTTANIGNNVSCIPARMFSNCTGLTSITIPDSVTSIGADAFANCTGLTSVTIGNGVTGIGEYAFYGCNSLTSITIPAGVTSIGNRAFNNCSKLTTVNYNATNCTSSDSVFDNCSALTTVNIGNNVSCIPARMFSNCTGLTSITIPDSVTSIGERAFYGCNSLTSITIPAGVTNIGQGALSLCYKLTKIEVDSSNQYYADEDGILFNKAKTKLIVYPAERSETSYSIPDNVTIEAGAFAGCSKLASITIPSSMTSIESNTFSGCFSVKSVTIPDSVTSIGNSAFSSCTNLTSVVIGKGVTSIGSEAFAACYNLTSITIPSNVTNIGDDAFGDCISLVEVCNLSALNITAGSEDNGGVALYAKNVYTGTSGASLLFDVDDCLFMCCDGICYFMKYVGTNTDVILPAFFSRGGTTISSYEIYNFAFVFRTNLTGITIPNGVTNIGDYAFAYCTGLTSVIIPDSVTSIGIYAFAFCNNLASVTFNTNSKLTSIGAAAFGGCAGLTSVTIPDSVTSIGAAAFTECTGLTSVTIPNSVTSIGESAFEDCPENLTIYGYAGSCAQQYASDNEIIFALVDGKTYVTLNAVSTISTPDITVYGITQPEALVEIFDGTQKIGETTSKANGIWHTTATLQNPANNSTHVLTAKIHAGEENEAVSEVISVLYNTAAPAFDSITIYHSNQSRTVTAETLGTALSAMTLHPGSKFTFTIAITNYDSSMHLFVVSTRNGVSKKLQAYYDPNKNVYITSGFFDASDTSYVPGEITLEYGVPVFSGVVIAMPILVDPSGVVYEAVRSNRVEGATASVYFKNSEGSPTLWIESELYDQANPVLTASDGSYAWDVPEGEWQVKIEEDGYKTAYSAWLPVPPVQTGIDIALETTQVPEVAYFKFYTNYAEVQFNQYMDISTINSDNIAITKNGGAVAGVWSAVDAEESGTDSSVSYAKTFRFTPDSDFAGTYSVSLDHVKNYAEIAIAEAYTGMFTVEGRVEQIESPETLSMKYGETKEIDISVSPATAAAGKTVLITSDNDYTLNIPQSVILDENGTARISVTAVMAGDVTLNYTVKDTLLSAKTEVDVTIADDISEVAVTGITVSPTVKTIEAGKTQQLTVTVLPENATNKNATWTSSNENVATVDENGLLTAIAAGTATITVTANDTANGTISDTCEITVEPATLTSVKIKSLPTKTSYFVGDTLDNAGLTLTATYSNGTTQTISGGFTCSPTTLNTAGMQTITVNYDSKSCTFEVTVNRINASGFVVEAIPDQTYTGNTITPTVVVKYNGETLTLNTDYTVAYANNINVGTATVTITGKGNYTGTTTATFNIIPVNASGFTVTAIPDQTYTGSAITPTVVVKFNGETLTLNTDYTVAYSSNTNAGTATVTITGKGNFTDTTTVTFTINAANASGFTVTAIPEQTYTGSAITPIVVVKFNGETLTLNTDYTVAYTNNTNVGTATVTITGKGNYTGTTTATFRIVAVSVTGITLSSTALSLQYKGVSKLTVTFNPTNATNKNVTWKSSNEKVAIVDANGNVTATGTGTATITATTVDGGKTASCTVTVKLVWWQWLIKIILFGWIWY